MKYIFLVIFISFAGAVTAQELQELTEGFYLTTECSINADLQRANPFRPKEILCLVARPFLSGNEIKEISKIDTIGKTRYFDLVITEKASKQLNQINDSFKNPKIAFVISNEIVFVLHLGEMSTIQRRVTIAVISNTDEIIQSHEKVEAYLADIKKQASGKVD